MIVTHISGALIIFILIVRVGCRIFLGNVGATSIVEMFVGIISAGAFVVLFLFMGKRYVFPQRTQGFVRAHAVTALMPIFNVSPLKNKEN